MVNCSKTLFVLRALFLIYFTLDSLSHINNIPEHAKELALKYQILDNHFKHLTNDHFPAAISTKVFDQNSEKIASILTYGQLGLAALSLFLPIFIPLLGLFNLFQVFIRFNVLKLLVAKTRVEEYEPFIVALALLGACCVFGCSKKCKATPEINEREKQKADKKKK